MNTIKITPTGNSTYKLEINGVDISGLVQEADIRLSLKGGSMAEVGIKVKGRVETEILSALVTVENKDGNNESG